MKSKGNTIEQLDVGKMVRHAMFEQGVNKAKMGRKLERNGSTIKSIIYRSSMQCYLLWELSVALNHNFFSDLAQQLNAATQGNLAQEQTELEVLKQEYQRIKEERDYLRKAVDLLSK